VMRVANTPGGGAVVLNNGADLNINSGQESGLKLTVDGATGNLATAGAISAVLLDLQNPTAGANAGIELGKPGTAETPFIDFHSSGLSTDYDARIIASGGSSTAGGGNLSVHGTLVLNNNLSMPTNQVIDLGNGITLNRPSGTTQININGPTYITNGALDIVNAGLTVRGGVRVVVNQLAVSNADGSVNRFIVNSAGEIAVNNSVNSRVFTVNPDSGDMSNAGAIDHNGSTAGFLGAVPVVRQVPSGSRGGNVALTNLLTGLANLGLITNSTTA